MKSRIFVLISLFFVLVGAGCTRMGSGDEGSIIGFWQLTSITDKNGIEVRATSKDEDVVQLVITSEKVELLDGSKESDYSHMGALPYFLRDNKIMVAKDDRSFVQMFEVTNVSSKNMSLKMDDSLMKFKRITAEDIVYDGELAKKIPKPPPPPNSADLLKGADGRVLSNLTQEQAAQACRAIHKRLPTVRELADDAKKYGLVSLERSVIDDGDFDQIPDGMRTRDFTLLEFTNADGKPDSLYYSNKNYYAPSENELGLRWFRTSSLNENLVFDAVHGLFKLESTQPAGQDGVRCK